MRIKLDKRFQRRFFYSLKGKNSWSYVAEQLKTVVHTLKGCAIEGNTIPKTLYDKIRTRASDKHIIALLNDNWGRVLGGRNSSGSTKKISEPKLCEELAEAVGIMLGDGSIYANKNKGVYQVRIASNFHNEQPYSTGFIKPLFEKLFGITGGVIRNPKQGVVYVVLYSRELTSFLNKIGLSGGKRKSGFGIPKWIKLNNAYLVSCIRGLIDTDGSVHRLSNRDPHLIRITFKNSNKVLSKDMRNGLLKLGFHPSKVTHRNLFLTRKADIKTFIDKIGFNNPKNIERFKNLAP